MVKFVFLHLDIKIKWYNSSVDR